jgi:hypothetical protein
MFISNDNDCNTLFSYNHLNLTLDSFDNDNYYETSLSLYNNKISYTCLDNENDEYEFNLSEYTNIEDPIFSLSISSTGDIMLNNNQYILHKEYFVADESYFFVAINKNLILMSITGEYKWAANKIISDRPYDASEIKIGKSFREGEMIYCGDYSVIILDGKLLYRDHKTKSSTEINYKKDMTNNLYEIEVGDNIISFKDKNGKSIYLRGSNYEPNENSMLRCEKSINGIVWDNGNGNILWSYPETPVVTTIATTSVEPVTSISTTYITNYSTQYITQTQTSLVTKTSHVVETYSVYGYRGGIDNEYYLGVNELKEYSTLYAKYGGNSSSPHKYIKWLIKSDDKPGYMYLSNADGNLSGYCLNVGGVKDNNSYYVTISKCSNTNYLFKWNIVFKDGKTNIKESSNIGVYKKNGSTFTNKNGNPYCLYYTENSALFVTECHYSKTNVNFKWPRSSWKNDKVRKISSIKSNIETTTISITTSTVTPVVTTSLITSVVYPTFTPTATNNIKPTQSNNAPSYALKLKGIYNGDSSLFLSVPKLESNPSFDISSSNKYYSWFVTSKTEPSYFYLSDGVSGNNGNPTNYCLDLGDYVNNASDNFNYLRIVNCSNAKYKFKYNRLSNKEYGTINVYDNNGNPYAINGVVVCIYYSGTPRVDNCNNSSNKMGWKMI